jgi:UDP-glucose 4-epimerase
VKAIMSGPTIALTGSTGFIGRYLLRELTRRQCRMRVLLRRPTRQSMAVSSAMIGDLMRPQNMSAALAGVDAIIHTAGLSPTMSGLPEDDYRNLNTQATVHLAQAAERVGVRRFVFISSLRAQAGATAAEPLTEALPPAPTDPYGRSKLAAEQALADLSVDWVALRLALVYGQGVGGNIARLMRLARSPYPLPFKSLTAPRSLLSLDNLVAAIAFLLELPQPLARPLIVADPTPLTVPEMITAMRRGLARAPALIPVPPTLLHAALQLWGQSAAFERLAKPLVADTSAIRRLGWQPSIDSAEGLEHLMRSERSTPGIEGDARSETARAEKP